MSTTPMLSPDGDVGDIPNDQVNQAVQSGFKMGVELQSDDGQTGVVPMDHAHEAIKSGMHLAPPKVQKPAQQMQGSMLAQALGGGTSSASAVANPQQPAEQFALDNPDQQGKLAVASAAGAGGAAAAEVLPAVVVHTTAGVKALTTWAAKNPLQAFALYNVIKELVPGAKKAIGLVKAAPE